MTDRTNPSRPVSAETGADAASRAEENGTRPEASGADTARRQFLRKLNHQEHVLDRAVREIDGVADQIRRVAANGAGEDGNWTPSPVSPLPGSGVAARPVQITGPTPGLAPARAAAPAAPIGVAQASRAQMGTPRADAAETVNVTSRPWPPKTEPVARPEPALRGEATVERRPLQEEPKPEPCIEKPVGKPVAWPTAEMKERYSPSGMVVIEADRGPIKAEPRSPDKGGGSSDKGGGGGGGGGVFHKRLGPVDFSASLSAGLKAIRQNLMIVMLFTIVTNILVLSIPVYLFQISDRVLTSRSVDTLVMLTAIIVGAVLLQSVFDAIRRMILMRTAVEVAAQLGAPILSAAARAALHSNGREYQTLGDLQQLRSFLVSGTLLSFLDAPIAPLFLVAVFLIHPHLGIIVVTSAVLLLIVTLLNQKATAAAFGEATNFQTKANLHLDSMSRNSQIINALAMIPEAVHIWGKDMAGSLKAQVMAQDRNIAFASLSKAVRLLTQVTMLGWGAHLALNGSLTGGMVIAASIIAGRALGPIEGAIEGWSQVIQSRAAYGRISALLKTSPLNFERLKLPRPEGRLDVERLLFVPQGTKRVVLNGITFALEPGDSLAVIGSSGAGKTTLGKMLVGSILPTSGNVRLDLMDLRNWDQRQFGESIGYLPQDVQLFPGTIKANIARMREDATDADIYAAAKLADVHDMIAMLPHGYETVVAADGSPLSGGQKQRVALARAFFGNPRMVVLDEPNSNLDTAGEAALTRALTHAKREKITVVTITQRPALLNSVDKVLLLVNGTVALFGMRQDVLKALASRGVNTEGNPLEQNQLP
ncbi:type I secretion system permease/ATPase (plasmid) [Ensifer adhaerens]|uniref:type I secretion system permease/ATPase n=1 Tax=Ensifer adhaerens TaxID=106592 RepID=UPI00210114E1|nr:type I secretion system permease/ATPase [Ensifer adhaerens]UTV39942.1 type I secretion system permease/ATPase [Ensifer adhaerens]